MVILVGRYQISKDQTTRELDESPDIIYQVKLVGECSLTGIFHETKINQIQLEFSCTIRQPHVFIFLLISNMKHIYNVNK